MNQERDMENKGQDLMEPNNRVGGVGVIDKQFLVQGIRTAERKLHLTSSG